MLDALDTSARARRSGVTDPTSVPPDNADALRFLARGRAGTPPGRDGAPASHGFAAATVPYARSPADL